MEEQEKETPKAPEASPASSSGEDEKLMAVLCYLGILVLIPLLTKKDDDFVKFHIQQGLALLVAAIVWGFAWIILAFIPVLGWLLAIAGWILLFVLMIIGIVNALNNAKKPLPVLGALGEKFHI